MNQKPQHYENSETFARALDAKDTLSRFRNQFHFPKDCTCYLAGNSLGLQPLKTRQYVNEALDDWARYGVEGHFTGKHPWLPYHEFLTESTARLVGAKPLEVVVMNTLTVNLHLMMISFYRPTPSRYKVLIEAGAFPSDQYAVASQVDLHAPALGFDPRQAVIELKPRSGEATLRPKDILETIEREGSTLALVLLGNVNYLTGQAFDMKAIAKTAHAQGCAVGFNLAHGAGNLKLDLHDCDVDFAVWCNYKYLNAGPGGLAGAFIHERHSRRQDLPRLAGWWGHNKQTRFKMGPVFEPIAGAEGWQVSNPPILQLAALRASMELFEEATIEALRAKSKQLTGYLEFLLDQLPREAVTLVTPRDPEQRGCQLSLRFTASPRELLKKLSDAGVVCDFREPDIIRAAPTPLYNSFEDVFRFVKTLEKTARG